MHVWYLKISSKESGTLRKKHGIKNNIENQKQITFDFEIEIEWFHEKQWAGRSLVSNQDRKIAVLFNLTEKAIYLLLLTPHE